MMCVPDWLTDLMVSDDYYFKLWVHNNELDNDTLFKLSDDIIKWRIVVWVYDKDMTYQKFWP